jgi:hypothetical protein
VRPPARTASRPAMSAAFSPRRHLPSRQHPQ